MVGLLGLITGSFLNAVIHRLPLGISLLNPRRSFCPGCQKTIPWYENLPVFSWLFLRGRCSGCAIPISLRYPLVELLTAALYLLAWREFGIPLAPVLWIFISLSLTATFIDLDHLIIPDEITLGGTLAGLLCASLLPSLLGGASWLQGLMMSATGAAVGYLLLWGVVEGGKWAFGRQRIRPVGSEILEVRGRGTDCMLKMKDEAIPLEELFNRSSDRVEASCAWVEICGERFESGKIIIGPQTLGLGDRVWELHELFRTGESTHEAVVRAEVTELILPREAMGFGDVKFLACIGAFLGWKGVLFTLFAASVAGAVIGLLTLAVTRGRSGGRIPFGPYLAFGALLWLFVVPELLVFDGLLFNGLGFRVMGFLLSPHPVVV